jgi:hypothetical protein
MAIAFSPPLLCLRLPRYYGTLKAAVPEDPMEVAQYEVPGK